MCHLEELVTPYRKGVREIEITKHHEMDKDKFKAKSSTLLVATKPEGYVYIRTYSHEIYSRSLCTEDHPLSLNGRQHMEGIMRA